MPTRPAGYAGGELPGSAQRWPWRGRGAGSPAGDDLGGRQKACLAAVGACWWRGGDGWSTGRSYRDAPEIDGVVRLTGAAVPGTLVWAVVTGAGTHDVEARIESG